jgi:hypothetical protein
MLKLFLLYDLYERHHVVGKLLRERGVKTALGVGRNLECLITQQGNTWIKRYIDWNSKALFHPIRLTTQPYDRANRFYLYVEKQG